MTMIRKVMPAQIEVLGDREVRVRMSTAKQARDEHILVPAGCVLDNYRSVPVMLRDHDVRNPVATASDINVGADAIDALATFAPVGISKMADETCGLVKAGILRGVSVGFEPIEMEPLDPKKPRGGQLITKWELMECSFCAVPVDTGAVVTARAEGTEDWKVGASRDLAIEDSDEWDGAAAEKSIFAHAGGDDFEPAKARKGFLVYNAAKPKEHGSYKLPIAHVVDGKMVVPKGAIRAAASRLPQTEIPDDVKERAQSVLDHYKEKAGMTTKSEEKDRALKAARTRMLVQTAPTSVNFRGLGHVAQLAWALDSLGYLHDCAAWEAEVEGDQSPVPAMLGEALQQLGKSLCAMADEEVAEMLAGKGIEMEDDEEEEIVVVEHGVSETDRAWIREAKTARARAWRRGIAIARAGKVLSASNKKQIEAADGQTDRAIKHHKAAVDSHAEVGRNMDAVTTAQEKAVAAQEKTRSALEDAQSAYGDGKADDGAKHLKRALEHHGKAEGHLSDANDAATEMKDDHADVGDAHNALGRCVRSIKRYMRAVLDGAVEGGEDSDSTKVQKSSKTDEDEGSRSVDFRRRQAELLALTSD